MLRRALGYGWIGVACLLGAAALAAVTWALLVGGVFDLAGADPLESGISALDDFDQDVRADWGERELGLLKVFLLTPAAIALIALATRGLVAIGRRMLAGRRPRPAVATRPPAPVAPEPVAPAPESGGLATEPVTAPSYAETPAPPVPAPAAAAAVAGAPVPQPAEARAAAGHSRLPIGETTSLRGIDRERMLVDATVVELLDPLPDGRAGGDPSERPERLVGVRIVLSNRGNAPFEDIPRAGSLLLADNGQRYTSSGTHEAALREIRLEPGDTVEGVLTFRLPADAQPSVFCFTPNLGVAPDSGEWELVPEPTPEGR